MSLAASLDTQVRWVARHGLARTVMRRGARRGGLDALLNVDDGAHEDPFPLYDRIREQGAFYQGSLARFTARHALCSEILRSDDFGVQTDRTLLPPPVRAALAVAQRKPSMSPIDPPSLLAVDPPDHTRFRRLVTKVFTPRAIEALRPSVERTTHELLDRLEQQRPGPVELVESYATQLPVIVICEILGVPVELREQFLRWGAAGAVTLDLGIDRAAFREAEAAIGELHQWMLGHFQQLRRTPGDNLLSRLVASQDAAPAADRLTEDELAGIGMLLLGAGFETTVNLIGNGVVQLTAHPDQLAILRAEPDVWPNAIEELLRFESPVQRTARFAKRDLDIAGQRLPAGAIVITLLGGANRDPAVFSDPNRFDVRREQAREHLAFSSGIHYCLGASLARIEGEIGLQTLFDRFPDVAAAGPPRRRITRTLRGYAELPVRLS